MAEAMPKKPPSPCRHSGCPNLATRTWASTKRLLLCALFYASFPFSTPLLPSFTPIVPSFTPVCFSFKKVLTRARAVSKMAEAMPKKPPSLCRHPGCPNLATRRSRCPEHERRSRGYGRRWRTEIRPLVIERDKGVCQECGASGARQVAHIIDRRAGGPDDPSNLRLLCDSCHSRETARETRFGRPPED